ncbi:MAG: O-antigen ligase family protein [Truepera sp.]|nr:O-antigen ligase family protein [Truepera sp.]
MIPTLPNPTLRLPLLSKALTLLAALVLGTALGLAVVSFPLILVLLAALGIALLASWQLLKNSHLTVTVFWVAFALQVTLFSGFELQGLYYPLYLLMIGNIAIRLMAGRLHVSPLVLSIYLLFYCTVLFGLFNLPSSPDFTVWQRLFIYSLGLIVLFQFTSLPSLWWLPRVQVIAGLVVSGWVIITAAQAGFADRGGVAVDQNFVAFIIALGLTPLLSRFLSTATSLLPRLGIGLGVALGIYAMLLLASRGMAVALAMVFVVMFARIVLEPRRSIPIILTGSLLAVVLVSLPGSDQLFNRFDDADLATANERLPLWEATLREYAASPLPQLLLGHGFDTSKIVALDVSGYTTSTHNAYLQILYEFGLIGLALFLAIHGLVISAAWRDNSYLALYTLGTVTFLLFANLSVNAPDGFLYWVVLGHLLAIGVWQHAAKGYADHPYLQ